MLLQVGYHYFLCFFRDKISISKVIMKGKTFRMLSSQSILSVRAKSRIVKQFKNLVAKNLRALATSC